jgi:hypothetical protein
MVFNDLVERSPQVADIVNAGEGANNLLSVEVFFESLTVEEKAEEPKYTVQM